MLKTPAVVSIALLALPFPATPQGIPSGSSISLTPKFEVASIRECLPKQPKAEIPPSRTFAGGISLGCWNLKTLIQMAYDVFASGKADLLNAGTPSVPVEGLPNWVDSALYSIEAKTENPQSAAMMRGPLMQQLLEARFGLRIHREQREVPVYLLTVAKGSLKLRRTEDGACAPYDFSEALNMKPTDRVLCALPAVTRRGPSTILDVHGITLGAFSKILHLDGRPVIDNTGLDGPFDIHLEWGSDPPDQSGNVAAAAVAKDPSPHAALIAAVREQLGLQLNSGRGSREFLVVDHIERPGEN